jgi:PAS domain S-box-containing protein
VFAKSYQGEDALNGKYVLVNNAFENALGRSASELLGKSDQEMFEPGVSHAFRDNDLRVMESGTGFTVQEHDVTPSGALRHYNSSKFPLLDASGQTWGVGGVAIDSTDLVHAREREARQADLLRAVFELSPTPAIRLSLGGDDTVNHPRLQHGTGHAAGLRSSDVESRWTTWVECTPTTARRRWTSCRPAANASHPYLAFGAAAETFAWWPSTAGCCGCL